MSSCVRNNRDSGGEKDAHLRYSPSSTSLNRVLNGTHHYVWFHRRQERFLMVYITVHYENTEALWITTEDCRPHQHSISELWMQCTDGRKSDKQLFSKLRSSPMLHLIPITLQYSPGLYNETDNTQCTSWYTMEPYLTTRLCRWYCTIMHNSKSYAEEDTASHIKY